MVSEHTLFIKINLIQIMSLCWSVSYLNAVINVLMTPTWNLVTDYRIRKSIFLNIISLKNVGDHGFFHFPICESLWLIGQILSDFPAKRYKMSKIGWEVIFEQNN